MAYMVQPHSGSTTRKRLLKGCRLDRKLLKAPITQLRPAIPAEALQEVDKLSTDTTKKG